ncbi:hypothetical protein NXY11_20630 [Parabacteroides faecis]|uniref:hypothetical protein n=1 Tax=Parabacteroides faecis TaxID=1217282 RepID=UPI0021645024|nr:hypothetical protein [Parabacteroides faecis]MCS2890787.1 hypothetical protein [Parabacteroides faecis]UVQ45545.1 hypothetical protein NXY11_20630 [Parabacteroides faecis]
MDTNNEELNIKVSGRKDLLIDSLNVLVTLVIVLGGSYIWGMHHTSKVLPAMLGGAYGFFISKIILYKECGRTKITVDKKYLIIENRVGVKLKQQIFRKDFMNNLSLILDYKETIWVKIKAFWTRGAEGPIQFDYENKSYRIGYGIDQEEINKLFMFLEK